MTATQKYAPSVVVLVVALGLVLWKDPVTWSGEALMAALGSLFLLDAFHIARTNTDMKAAPAFPKFVLIGATGVALVSAAIYSILG